MTRCANCGVANDPDATFCQACHHFLAWEEAEARRPTPVVHIEAQPAEPPVPVLAPRADLSARAGDGPDEPADADHPVVEVDASEDLEVRAAVDPGDGDPPEPAMARTVLDTVATGRRLALASGREDLAEHLAKARANVLDQVISVAVVGEFKRGKSTLVNAILQTAVCPVDADIVTAVPTMVRYGEQIGAAAHLEPTGESAEPLIEDVPLSEVGAYVSEVGNAGNRRRLRMVEVVLPRPILRSGLSLIDTPGVGGLDSAHGVITLGALSQAQGVLFVTDASQELTRPEVDFLKTALARCPNAACVMTKTDLHMEWRRIAKIDEQHLRDAGLDVPVIPVSSFLRLAADGDPQVLVESGFPGLVDFILGTIVSTATAQRIETAEREVDFIAAQLEEPLRAEQAVLDQPAQAEQVVERLDDAHRKSERLASPTATWQQMLTDGIQDLVADVEFDLQERLRTVMRDVEGIIDEGDPKQTWANIEVWLRKTAISVAVENFDRMEQKAYELAQSVASAFDMGADSVTSAAAVGASDSLANVKMATAASLENPAGKIASMLMAGRTATLVPMLLVGALGGALMPIVAPIAAVLAAGIGQKVIRDERRRQVAYRRQQAKSAARKYVDEVAFMVSKDSRDALRITQRALRDDFQSRAAALQRSSEAALHAVRSAVALAPDERAARSDELARDRAAVVELRTRRSHDSESLRVVNG